ncbi:MAG: ribokinase, partial [Brevundimonas sp.]
MRITVVGSINLDFVATAPKLPRAGETVTGAELARHPGGKGANQALAAQRLGAEVCLIGRVGRDSMAEEAMALLLADDVDIGGVLADADQPTGVALIAVDPDGENQIVVAAGANHSAFPEQLPARIECPVILQLELPVETVEAAVGRATDFVCVNLAPAQPVSDQLLRRADLIVVNETEAAYYGDLLHHGGGRVVVTQGAK